MFANKVRIRGRTPLTHNGNNLVSNANIFSCFPERSKCVSNVSFIILIQMILISACSHVVNVTPPVSLPPLVEKKPLSVGVVYSEDLQNHKCTASKDYIADSWEIQLGPSNIEMFDLILGGLFENIVKLDSVKSGVKKGLKNVIEIRLQEYNGCEASWPIINASIVVTYEATLYGEDATVITTWQGSGRAMPSDSHESCGALVPHHSLTETRYLAYTTCIAMRRAAADFIVNLQNNVKISDYLGK